MNNLAKRSLALILALVLCLSLLPVTVVPVSAASYIYNWGTRGEVATSLSQNALAFYTGNNTYDALSSQAGGTGTSDAPNSNLYKALQNLMSAAHTKQTSYNDTRDLFKYTDCQNGGGKISSFYSGTGIGPDWDGGSTWNREHTWPNSKGLEGRDEDDIMMLRPTAISENSSRGNTAYGESSGYYDPNSTSGGKYNLHGDVARIFLYVYVRWGITNGNGEADSNGKAYTTWGSQGVIESLDVLLDWMAEDPVDTWEMGRNDSVQSITGTRNVFVDYPELAFLLFGEEIPSTMTTPSGNSPAHQHEYVDGVCDCGAIVEQAPAVGGYEKATIIAVGDTVALVYESKKMELSGISTTSTKYGIGAAYTDVPTGAMPLLVVAGASDGTVAFKTEDGKYLYWTSGNSLNVNATLNAKTSWTVTFDASGNAVITNASDTSRVVKWNSSSPRFACYTSGQTAVQLYKVVAGTPAAPVCQHETTTLVNAEAATCTKAGYTGDVVCANPDCGKTLTTGQEVPVNDHTYVDGACSACGAKDLSGFEETTATVTFADTANRTEYSATKQVWVENGVTVTNEKGSSTSNVYDTVSPIRVYQKASLTVAYNDMTKIEFTCSSAEYATNLKNSITDGVASVSDKVVTVTFGEPVDELHIASMTAQARVNSITVTAISCSHADTTVEGKADATCTTDGHTGNTVCTVCGAIVTEGEVITAPGHKYVDGACDVCGEAEPTEPEVPVVPAEPTFVTSIASGTAYKLGLFSTSKNATYYFTGAMSGYYGATETAYETGIDVFVEETDGGYYLYFIDASSAKQYINLVASGTHKNFTFNTTETSVYTWDAEKNALCTTVGDEVCYIGTYGSYVTMGVLQNSNLKDTDYIARLYTMGGSSNPDAPVCEHTNTNVVDAADATCTAKGHTGKTVCDDCGATVNAGSETDYLPHTYENGACTVCSVKAPETALSTKQAYKFGMIQYNVSPTELYYLTGAMDGYYMATTSVADEAVDVYVEETEGGYYLYTYINSVKHYINMVISNGYVNGAFEATASTVYTFDAEKNTLVATVNDGLYWFGTRNDKNFETVGPVLVEYNGFYCQLYKFVEGNPNEPQCKHTETKIEGAVAATCTTDGHTGKTVCVACGVTIDEGEVIEASHTFVDDVCTVCGEEKSLIVTITFDDKAKRTEYSTSKQVWVENGITVTNDKAASTTNVGDYFNPARFYKSSNLKIEYPGMTQIVIDCTGIESKYVTAFSSLSGAINENGLITITFAEPVNEYVITGLTAQGRVNGITITYTKATDEPACEHSFVDGVCSVCGHKLGNMDGNEIVDHNDAIYLLLNTMFGENAYPLDGQFADFDGSGAVDQDDAVYLLLNVLFGDNFYPLYTTPVLPKNEEEN